MAVDGLGFGSEEQDLVVFNRYFVVDDPYASQYRYRVVDGLNAIVTNGFQTIKAARRDAEQRNERNS